MLWRKAAEGSQIERFPEPQASICDTLLVAFSTASVRRFSRYYGIFLSFAHCLVAALFY